VLFIYIFSFCQKAGALVGSILSRPFLHMSHSRSLPEEAFTRQHETDPPPPAFPLFHKPPPRPSGGKQVEKLQRGVCFPDVFVPRPPHGSLCSGWTLSRSLPFSTSPMTWREKRIVPLLFGFLPRSGPFLQGNESDLPFRIPFPLRTPV